ncbi:hypothetical protein TREES_T100009713 [Tupaia chinensis]|uniref:Uncharacterized protein n=1 Tax=Tupaia chinensis TaxID=246437 RepID=L9L471_TUPCH|nr:hypothetical protein TREES_T100009713 [Tupaia chinensis]
MPVPTSDLCREERESASEGGLTSPRIDVNLRCGSGTPSVPTIRLQSTLETPPFASLESSEHQWDLIFGMAKADLCPSLQAPFPHRCEDCSFGVLPSFTNSALLVLPSAPLNPQYGSQPSHATVRKNGN